MDGEFRYCFSNQMSSMTPKVVMFNMDVGDAPKDRIEGDGEVSAIFTTPRSYIDSGH